jgi:hypothetical protein
LLRKRSNDEQVKSDYTNDLRFEFDGDYELENVLKTQIENVIKSEGIEIN